MGLLESCTLSGWLHDVSLLLSKDRGYIRFLQAV